MTARRPTTPPLKWTRVAAGDYAADGWRIYRETWVDDEGRKRAGWVLASLTCGAHDTAEICDTLPTLRAAKAAAHSAVSA